MFWVLKRTVSLRRFFWVPITYVAQEIRKILFRYAFLTKGLGIWVQYMTISPLISMKTKDSLSMNVVRSWDLGTNITPDTSHDYALLVYAKYECRWNLVPKSRPFAPLDTSAWALNGGFRMNCLLWMNCLLESLQAFITSQKQKPPSKIFLLTIPMRYFFCGSFVLFMFMLVMLTRLFVAALWSPAGKGLTLALVCDV